MKMNGGIFFIIVLLSVGFITAWVTLAFMVMTWEFSMLWVQGAVGFWMIAGPIVALLLTDQYYRERRR